MMKLVKIGVTVCDNRIPLSRYIFDMAKSEKLFNPFEGRNKEDVWLEIRNRSQRITRDQALKRIRDSTNNQAKST